MELNKILLKNKISGTYEIRIVELYEYSGFVLATKKKMNERNPGVLSKSIYFVDCFLPFICSLKIFIQSKLLWPTKYSINILFKIGDRCHYYFKILLIEIIWKLKIVVFVYIV